jgi:hypothetical protein
VILEALETGYDNCGRDPDCAFAEAHGLVKGAKCLNKEKET